MPPLPLPPLSTFSPSEKVGQRDAGGDGTWEEGGDAMDASEERTSNIIVCDGMPDRERRGACTYDVRTRRGNGPTPLLTLPEKGSLL